jgi:hypothetical protein
MNFFRVGQKLFTGGRKRNSLFVAMKKRRAQLVLEQADALGHIGLHRM